MLTTQYVPGAPVWLDLGARDIDAAAGFYHALFGWEFRTAGPEAGGYGMFQIDGRTVAAIGPLTEEGARPSWGLYFGTRDADATTKAAEEAGGAVRFAAFDVFGLGRMAGLTDPGGADFSVWQQGETRGLDVVTAPNTLCWTELLTPDARTARDFYRSVLGWEFEDVALDAGMTYTVVSPSGGGPGSSQGGIMQLPEEEDLTGGPDAGWHPYFEVPDCDATVALATARGAKVTVPAMDLEGVGRLAMLKDPSGAGFSVLTGSDGRGHAGWR